MTQPNFELTRGLVAKVLAAVDAGLSSGLGEQKPGSMCVEAAVCYAMGLPHGDDPPCVHPLIRDLKIRLNDSAWSGKAARAKGMRRIAVLQLGTADCGFDQGDFAGKLALFTVKVILPIALSAANLPVHADVCSKVTTLEEALTAARSARSAAESARSARSAAESAWSAARDKVLISFAAGVENILVEMNVPAVKFLKLLDQ